MTSKKFAKYLEKQCKAIINFSLEPIFEEYIVNVNGKRVGVVYKEKFYVMYAPVFDKFKKVMPDAVPVNPFGWAYHNLVEIENLENVEKLKEIVLAVYDDMYFNKEFVADISTYFYSYQNYPDVIKHIYDSHITFLRFCYDKGLLKINWVDGENRILKFYFNNNDLTEDGHKIFHNLYIKWLKYNEKNDERSEIRGKDVKRLEKYYQELM
ncbi:hypothetical protein CAPN002_17450 [Capnocytophaga stomatis]|uniref:hypothetical protein n=1 Tax=Capnocytophaga stomatis TaxID=1848904 RepID=UPI001950468A|nr:hypothetical protein [Capnocytophaga stomatis]GIJ94527.1 hypothetical protein CAPN002_17450 [Capnocytophaga stomatis]